MRIIVIYKKNGKSKEARNCVLVINVLFQSIMIRFAGKIATTAQKLSVEKENASVKSARNTSFKQNHLKILKILKRLNESKKPLASKHEFYNALALKKSLLFFFSFH